jgi:aminoglycoside phosphotransferase (APT) family kinase protein
MKKRIIKYFREQGHKNIKIKQMPEAWSNFHTYRVSTDKGDHIFKMFTDFIQNEKKVATRDYELLKIFKAIAPKTILFDTKIFDHPFILMEFIKGGTLHKKKWTDAEAKKTAQLIAKVHSTRISPKIKTIFKTTQPKMPQDLKGAKVWAKKLDNKKISKRIIRLINKISKQKSLKFKPTICHGDFKSLNIINGKKGLALVDWESANLGDPADDWAQLFLISDTEGYSSAPNQRQRKLMLSEYRKLRKEKDNFEERITWIYKAKDVIELMWHVRYRLYQKQGDLQYLEKDIKKLEKKWL